ncbi:MAG: hypothetical protein JWR07_4820 [Nevskia sp.]|nr:hypothetical protein [Nevskia sp.]
MISTRITDDFVHRASFYAMATGIFKRHALGIALLAVIAPCYFAWTWNAEIGQLGSDGPNYLMMASHYAHGSTGDPVYSDNATYSRFPPLYPLLLSWCHAADDFRRIHAITTACLILALIALYAWLFLEGLSPVQATLLAILFAALPGSWLAGLTVQSEYLYVFWSLLAITLLTAYQRSMTINMLFAAAIAISLATLTRTIGIALFAPFLLALSRAPIRQAALALVVSALPLLIWHLLHRSRISYSDALGFTYGSDAWGVLRSQLAREIPAMRRGFGGSFLLHTQLGPIADSLGVLCLVGASFRAVQLKPDALYIFSNLLILLIWPYPADAQRFLWVLMPMLMAQPLLAFSTWNGAPVSARTRQQLTCILAIPVLTMLLPAFSLASDRYRSAAYTELPDARIFVSWYGEDRDHAWDVVAIQTSVLNSLHRIPEHVPADGCVIATRPDLLSYFGQRRSYFPPLNSVPNPYFDTQLRAHGCHFVFEMSSVDGRYPVSMFPMERLGDQIDVVLYNTIPDGPTGKSKITSALIKID